jgi:phosphomannomutase
LKIARKWKVPQAGTIERYDARPSYLDDLKTKIRLDRIAAAKADMLTTHFGEQVVGIWINYCASIGLEVETLHDWRDVRFGGKSPEPSENKSVNFESAVSDKNLTLGLATDGDGDRFGVVDSNGEFITPNE